jgi:hypothetical protein
MWCAVTGSDLDGDSEAAQTERDTQLWKLHEIVTDKVFHNQANITFRSELVRELLPHVHWKVVTDTVGGDGNLVTSEEMRDTAQACRDLYEADLDAADVDAANWGIVGLYAKHVNRTSRPDALSWRGRGGPGETFGTVCGAGGPPAVTMMAGGFVATEETIRDIAAVDEELAGILLGHEFGHALWLGHGNGQDDGTNDLWDDFCDEGEEDTTTEMTGDPECLAPNTIMTPGSCGETRVATLGSLQIQMTRGIAEKEPGAVDPPGPITPGPVASDGRSDARLDVGLDRVDLAEARVTVDEDRGVTLFSHSLYRFTEKIPGVRFVAFVDTDGDPSTGGNPGDLVTPTFPTAFQGAELITIVTFGTGEFGPTVVWDLLKWNGTGFQDINDLRIRANIGTLFVADPYEEVSNFVAIEVPNDIVGTMSVPLRLQAIAEDDASGTVDRIPDLAAEAVGLRLVPPVYPECSVEPLTVAQGETTTVTVTGLIPDRMVKVILGSEMVAIGTADEAGAASVAFRIPADAQTGQRLVTVGSQDTALTADCSVVVEGRPITLAPATSTNPPGEDHTVTAVVRDEAGDPVQGVLVDFSVGSGPNAGAIGECSVNTDCTTDADGMVLFTYTGAGGPGVDQITAAFQPEGPAPRVVSNVAFKFWDADCNENQVADSCDIDCGGFEGLCGQGFVGVCGLSADANGDGVPDECNSNPVCDYAFAEPAWVWPPNHTFVPVDILGVTDPDGDPLALTVDSIFQDEPVDTFGDGRFVPDGDGVGTATAEIRAERSGTRKVPGNGRFYHIGFTVDDDKGGSCTGEVAVAVPHDESVPPIDDGALFDSTAP